MEGRGESAKAVKEAATHPLLCAHDSSLRVGVDEEGQFVTRCSMSINNAGLVHLSTMRLSLPSLLSPSSLFSHLLTLATLWIALMLALCMVSAMRLSATSKALMRRGLSSTSLRTSATSRSVGCVERKQGEDCFRSHRATAVLPQEVGLTAMEGVVQHLIAHKRHKPVSRLCYKGAGDGLLE